MIQNIDFATKWVPFSNLQKYAYYQDSLDDFQQPLKERAGLDDVEWHYISQIENDHEHYTNLLKKSLQKANKIWYEVFAKNTLLLFSIASITGHNMQKNFVHIMTTENLNLYLPILAISLVFIASVFAYYKALPQLEAAYRLEAEWAREWLGKVLETSKTEKDAQKLAQLKRLKVYFEMIIDKLPQSSTPATLSDKDR